MVFKRYHFYICRAPSAPPKRRPDLLSTADNPEGNLHVVDEVVIGNTVIDDPGSMKVGKIEICMFTSPQLFVESEKSFIQTDQHCVGSNCMFSHTGLEVLFK